MYCLLKKNLSNDYFSVAIRFLPNLNSNLKDMDLIRRNHVKEICIRPFAGKLRFG